MKSSVNACSEFMDPDPRGNLIKDPVDPDPQLCIQQQLCVSLIERLSL